MLKDIKFSNQKPSVIFLPGIVTPVELSYQALLGIIGNQIQPIMKELEVYATDSPPAGYGLGLEVEGIQRVADAAGLERFHLVGFSGGGAVALAFTAKYPGRIQSLALVEPAWIGSVDPEDAGGWAELERVMALPPDERMPAFVHWHMRPGIQLPSMLMPPEPPPSWMLKRPAGMEAISRAFKTYSLDQQRFRDMKQPVYYALGSMSTLYFERGAQTLSRLFPNMQVEVYEGCSHFDPPQRTEPERFARALQELWTRSDVAMSFEKKRG